MSTYKNVHVDKLANIYFDGNVISRKITFSDDTIKTLGVMMPGKYNFNTQSKELMEIISGELNLQLKDETTWNNIKDGMSFNVSKNSSFTVKVVKIVHYSCSYFD
jgi:purine/pyrimidine-nucleoside phosphorylase